MDTFDALCYLGAAAIFIVFLFWRFRPKKEPTLIEQQFVPPTGANEYWERARSAPAAPRPRQARTTVDLSTINKDAFGSSGVPDFVPAPTPVANILAEHHRRQESEERQRRIQREKDDADLDVIGGITSALHVVNTLTNLGQHSNSSDDTPSVSSDSGDDSFSGGNGGGFGGGGASGAW